MNSSQSAQVKQESCPIVVYYRDQNTRKIQNTQTIPFVKETAQKAHEMICDYFQLHEEWDRKLFETMFLHDEDVTKFEYQGKENGQIFGVEFIQNKYLVDKDMQEEYIPVENQEKIGVVVNGNTFLAVKKAQVLEYKDLKKNSSDYSLIALFNSPSFYRVEEYNINFCSSRTLQKIDISYSKT